jgi:hypothetical protein
VDALWLVVWRCGAVALCVLGSFLGCAFLGWLAPSWFLGASGPPTRPRRGREKARAGASQQGRGQKAGAAPLVLTGIHWDQQQCRHRNAERCVAGLGVGTYGTDLGTIVPRYLWEELLARGFVARCSR